MDEDRPPPYVHYAPVDASLHMFEDLDLNEAPPYVKQLPPEANNRRRILMKLLKIVLPVCVFIAGIVVTLLLVLPLLKEKEYPAPPEVANLTLVAVAGDSMTVTWERPEGRFDYYWIEVTDTDGGSGGDEPHRVGSCANGTIIHPDQTRVTCGHLKACTNVSISVRTHITGPPERTSTAVVLPGIFISGKDPDSPTNITVLEGTPSQSKLVWDPPTAVSGFLGGYTVKVCDAFGSCAAEADVSGCREFNTPVPSLEFETTVDTPYCVLVAANANCGADVLSSRPASAEVRTPSFAPGDFELWGTATGPRSVEIVASVPEIKNGALDRCYGTLRGAGIERKFTCDDHGGKSSIITIARLLPGTKYECTVTFANVFDGREMATSKSISVKTPNEPVEQDWSRDKWQPLSHDRPYSAAGVATLPAPAVLILWAATVLALWRLHWVEK
ncbi:uncharacterized protein LOC144105699 isoform X2 [Amblyomma americanum]